MHLGHDSVSCMTEEEFLDHLTFPDLKKEYHKEKEWILRDFRESIKGQREEKDRTRRIGIDSDKNHRDILNGCVNPFTQKGKISSELKYHFVRGSPLYELGEKNFDFLLYKPSDRSPVAVMGEAKGSVSKHSGIVKEALGRKQVAQDNMDYMKENYLSTSKDVVFEYVLGVPAIDSLDTIREIVKMGGGIVVWSVSRMEALLSASVPDTDDEDLRRSMMHSDKKLMTALDKVDTALQHFDIYPQSHPVSHLRLLVLYCNLSDNRLIVRPSLLGLVMRNGDLFYLDEKEIDHLVDSILKMGTDIGFLERLDHDEYAILSRHRKPHGLEEEVKEKWIAWKADSEEQEKEEKLIADLQTKFRQEREKRPELLSFEDKDDS